MKPYYDDGNGIVIYHGDYKEVLPVLKVKFDLLMADGPYELFQGWEGGGAFGKRDSLVKTAGFTDKGWDLELLKQFENWFCFCSKAQLKRIIEKAEKGHRWNLITWCKPNPVPTCGGKYLPDVEYVVHCFGKGRLFGDIRVKSCYAKIPCGNKNTSHPNEKPIELIHKLVTLGTQPGELIIDPFAGSGTTGRAAKDLGRKCVMVEKEEMWCEVAADRCSQEILPL